MRYERGLSFQLIHNCLIDGAATSSFDPILAKISDPIFKVVIKIAETISDPSLD